MAHLLSKTDSYEKKFSQLDRNMRWEIANILRETNLPIVNEFPTQVTPRISFYTKYGKRVFDILIASSAFILLAPINALIAIVTMITLGTPLLFRQERIGLDGNPFTLIKFRNMREAYDTNGHPLPGYLRVTKFGKVLRRTSLDELLNFWSIIKGDMSLIGPRPLLPEYLERFSDRHRKRLCVRPGLECPLPARQNRPTTYDDQFENDIWYVENVSFLTDLKLVLCLIRTVFDRRESHRRASSRRGSFMGYNPDGSIVDSSSVPESLLDEVLFKHGILVK